MTKEEIMKDRMYRQVLRMRALDRWENEGGTIDADVTSAPEQRSIEQNENGNDVLGHPEYLSTPLNS